MNRVSRRAVLRSVGWSSLAITGIATQTVSADDVLYAEDFADHNTGDVPSEYVLAGNDDQNVTDETAVQGDHSYEMNGSHGGCWRAIARTPLDVADELVIEGQYKLGDGEPGCHDGTGSIGFRTEASSSWSAGSGTQVLSFYPDETAESGGETVGEYDGDEWNSFAVEYSRNHDDGTVTQRCIINDGTVTTVTRDETDYEDDLSALEIRSDDYTVYWDDLVVRRGTLSETALEAEFSFEPVDPDAGTVVTFDAEQSAGEIDTYDWDFDDGETETGVEVTHSYDEPGDYEIELTIEGSTDVDSTTETIVVGEASPALEASLDLSSTDAEIGDVITFDAERSTGEIDSYEWGFGDGSSETGATIDHVYDESGEYEVELTVEGPTGVDSTTETVVVSDPNLDLEAAIDVSATTAEPDDAIVFDAWRSSGEIDTYEWDFGDGSTQTGLTVDHTYTEPGEYEVELTVEGPAGDESKTETIVVDDPSPELEASIDVAATTVEPGDVITFDAGLSSGEIDTYEWDFGDGSSETGPTVDHVYADPGQYEVELTVEDGTEADTEQVDIDVDASEPDDRSDEAHEADETADDEDNDDNTAVEIEVDEVPGFGVLAGVGGITLALAQRLRTTEGRDDRTET